MPVPTRIVLLFALASSLLVACSSQTRTAQTHAETKQPAPQPLYRDPSYNGAADPTVMWNPMTGTWFMYYTNRRASMENPEGVEWVHGTPIGIAESADGGVTWKYKTDAVIHYPAASPDDITYWAPDVYFDGTQWHMYLTIVPGIFSDWKHPRTIAHLTSSDMLEWHYQSTLSLANEKVIDADVVALPEGGYRMFYNNEPDGKSVYFADSDDLYHWQDRGKAALASRGEGPVVFNWRGHWWLIVDAWRGLAVYRSDDLMHWQQQPGYLLGEPGTGMDDGINGGHPDVVVENDRAYLFYFTHGGRVGENARKDNVESRRSAIQVTELSVQDNWLHTDRNAPTFINLPDK